MKTWKRGLAPIISATMAPNDQMSIGVEYLAQPSRISGALAKELGQCLNQRVEGTLSYELNHLLKHSKARSPVPQGDHLVGVHSDGDPEGSS